MFSNCFSLAHDLKVNGGFTSWLAASHDSGYCVGNNNYSLHFQSDNEQEIADKLYKFMVYAEVLQMRGLTVDAIGGWLDKDTNTIYLDIVQHIENLADAIELAKLNQELAIYEIHTATCIDI